MTVARDAEILEAQAVELGKLGAASVLPLAMDLGAPDAAERVAAMMGQVGERHGGRLDGLVVNHGLMVGLGVPPALVPDADDQRCLRVNLEAAHLLAKHALPLLTAAGGSVVFVGSCEGFLSQPTEGNGLLAYRAAKAGLHGLMVALHQLYVDTASFSALMLSGRSADGSGSLRRVVACHPGVSASESALEGAMTNDSRLTPSPFSSVCADGAGPRVGPAL